MYFCSVEFSTNDCAQSPAVTQGVRMEIDACAGNILWSTTTAAHRPQALRCGGVGVSLHANIHMLISKEPQHTQCCCRRELYTTALTLIGRHDRSSGCRPTSTEGVANTAKLLASQSARAAPSSAHVFLSTAPRHLKIRGNGESTLTCRVYQKPVVLGAANET